MIGYLAIFPFMLYASLNINNYVQSLTEPLEYSKFYTYSIMFYFLIPLCVLFGDWKKRSIWWILAYTHGLAHLFHPAFHGQTPNPHYTPFWDFIVHSLQCLCIASYHKGLFAKFASIFFFTTTFIAGLTAHIYGAEFMATTPWLILSGGGVLGATYHMNMLNEKQSTGQLISNYIIWFSPYIGYLKFSFIPYWDDLMNKYGLFQLWFWAYFMTVQVIYLLSSKYRTIVILSGISTLFAYSYPGIFIGVVSFCWFYKPMRWYIMSYHFPYLYKNKRLAKFLGIRFYSDQTFETNRKETKLYMSGLFVKFFEWFTGMSVSPKDMHRKGLMHLQGLYAKKLDFKPYFDKWEDKKKLTGAELEDVLSDIVLTETNRAFNALSPEQMNEMRKYLKVLRTIVNGLTGGERGALSKLYTNFRTVLKLRQLLLSMDENVRMLFFTPQLTFVNNFARMIILREATINDNWKFELRDNIDFSKPRKVDFKDLEANQFLLPTSFYFVLVVNGELSFVSRQRDYANHSGNMAFGPKGFQCPGKTYTIKAIQSVISFFQAMNATIEGHPKISGGRFPDVSNKDEIIMTFHKISEMKHVETEKPDYKNMDGAYVLSDEES